MVGLFVGGGVGVEEKEGSFCCDDYDKRDDECQLLGLFWGVVVGDKGVVDGGYDEVGDVVFCVVEVVGQGVGCVDDVFVEKVG